MPNDSVKAPGGGAFVRSPCYAQRIPYFPTIAVPLEFMDRRIQLLCLGAGVPAAVRGGLLARRRLVPPPSTSATAAQIAAFYRDNTDQLRVGLLLLPCALSDRAPTGSTFVIAPGCRAYTTSMTGDVEDGEAGPVSESLGTCPARLSIGAEVLAADGLCGDLIRVIVDPVAQAVTHVVVAPAHHVALGRLVPIDLLVTDADQIGLKCTTARFKELEDAEEIQFLAADSDAWGYGQGHVSSWPYYGLGMPLGQASQPIVSDCVPTGEVQVRRGDRVHATDGPIGSVQGLVIDPTNHHVTHVLLQEGHLWGRKQVAIPIRSTSGVGEEIRVELSKDQVQNLPEVKLSLTR